MSEETVEETNEEAIEDVAAAADALSQAAENFPNNLDFLMDVTLQVTVEVGRARMAIQDLLHLSQGSVIELTKLAGEPLDIYVNQQHIARGEAVIVNEKFGVRITDILSHQDRMDTLGQND